MAENDWKFAKPQSLCCTCSGTFGSDPYYSVLLEKVEGLTRQDYCSGCFKDKRPQNVYYFWRVATPAAMEENPVKQRPRVDTEFVLDFFKRMEGDESPQKLAFRYILALMLSRKKVLILEGKRKDPGGGEVHVFREKRGGQAHQVRELVLNEEETLAVSAELGVLLGLAPISPVAQEIAAENSSVHPERST